MSHDAPKRGAKDSLRLLAGPLLSYFDRRFQDVYDRLDERVDRLSARVATEVETISEMTLGMQRFVDTSTAQISELIDQVTKLRDDLEKLRADLRTRADAEVRAGA
jgi:archaellum component FlaC